MDDERRQRREHSTAQIAITLLATAALTTNAILTLFHQHPEPPLGNVLFVGGLLGIALANTRRLAPRGSARSAETLAALDRAGLRRGVRVGAWVGAGYAFGVATGQSSLSGGATLAFGMACSLLSMAAVRMWATRSPAPLANRCEEGPSDISREPT